MVDRRISFLTHLEKPEGFPLCGVEPMGALLVDYPTDTTCEHCLRFSTAEELGGVLFTERRRDGQKS